MNHPLSIYSNKNHSPIWAYLFLGACLIAIFSKKRKVDDQNILSNPISMDSIEKRFWDIMGDFPAIKSPSKFIEEVIEEFNDSYRIDVNAKPAALKYQDKFMPYFELAIALRMVLSIYSQQSRHLQFYQKNNDEIPAFPNSKSGQWLKKYINRRLSPLFVNKKWLEIYEQLNEFERSMKHYFVLLSLPDMIHARQIDFNKGTLQELSEKIERVTNEISAKQRRLKEAELISNQSPTEDFLDAGNGWKWVKILDSYNKKRDEIEAILMGHCATPEWENSFLISLRDPKKGEPWATATVRELTSSIYKIGQIKGRGNAKPSKKFEPQILSLFLDPHFIYQDSTDSSDWRLKDFEAGNRELIIAKKPYFIKPELLHEYFDLKELTQLLANELKENYKNVSIDGENTIILQLYDNTLSKFIFSYFRRYNRNEQKYEGPYWLKYLEEGHIEIEDIGLNNSEAADYFKDEIYPLKEGKIIYKAIVKELSDEGIDIDPDDVGDTISTSFHYGYLLGQKLDIAIYTSLESSYQSSLFNQLENGFQDFLKEINYRLPNGIEFIYLNNSGEEIELDNIYYSIDANMWIKINLNNINSSLILDINNFDLEGEIDNVLEDLKSYMDNIRLDDYSSEYFLENFKEYYIDELVDLSKKVIKK